MLRNVFTGVLAVVAAGDMTLDTNCDRYRALLRDIPISYAEASDGFD